MAARHGGADDHLLVDEREQRGTSIGLQVEADLLLLFRLAVEPDDVPDGRAGGVEAVVSERRDDVLVDHHQRQWLPSAILVRHEQVMRRDVDGVGLRRELVLGDGRCN